MKIKLILLFYIVFVASCLSTSREDKPDFTGLGSVVYSYYWNHYGYPANVYDLLIFLKEGEFPDEFQNLQRTITANSKQIKISRNYEENSIEVAYRDSLIYSAPIRTPCDELEYNLSTYVSSVLFFDKSGQPILDQKDELKQDFVRNITELKKHYHSYLKNEKNLPKYIMLQFRRDNGLTTYCNDLVNLDRYNYIIELSAYLIEFVDKNELYKIIFISNIYKE